MILKNPTKEDISIIFKGAELNVKALGEIEVSDMAGKYWKSVHSFLIKIDEFSKPVAKEVVEETKEAEETEEVAKPSKPVTKKGTKK